MSVPVTPISEHALLPAHSGPNEKSGFTRGTNQSKTSSLTPPPSAQSQPAIQNAVQARIRTQTPSPALLLSSPPPTVDTVSATARGPATDFLALSASEIICASAEELRSMITALLPNLQEARTDAAHYKLQYHMLSIESAETIERIQVEMDMAQRELEVLQAAEQHHPTQPPTPILQAPPAPEVDPKIRPVHIDLYNAMTSDLQQLKAANHRLETTVHQQKRMIVQQEGEIASFNDRITLLRERLQENRDHLNRYRRPTPLSPNLSHSTPSRSVPSSSQKHQAHHTHEPRPFAALLEASTLMQAKSGSGPKTPKRKRGSDNLPLTPQTAQPKRSHNIFATPQRSQQKMQQKIPTSAPPLALAAVPRYEPPVGAHVRGGHESDGTVSADDDSEAETEVEVEIGDRVRSVVQERRDKEEQQHRGLKQSRLFGQVRKAGVVRESEEQAQHAKRAKVDMPPGLGAERFAGR